MAKLTAQRNCVIETYRGVDIHLYERVTIRITSEAKKRLIDLEQDTGISAKRIICNSGKPCAKCEGTFVEVFDKEGNIHKIPRGIISKRNLL